MAATPDYDHVQANGCGALGLLRLKAANTRMAAATKQAREEKVLRFNVAMDNSLGVAILNGVYDRFDHISDFILRKMVLF